VGPFVSHPYTYDKENKSKQSTESKQAKAKVTFHLVQLQSISCMYNNNSYLFNYLIFDFFRFLISS